MPAILLKSQEMFLVSNNNTTVNGDAGSGIEVVIIDQGVTGVLLDVNVERVALSGNTSDYKFQNQSNSLVIYSGSSTVVTVPIQPDANGTQVTFNNGTVNVFTGQSGMTLGGVSVVAGSGSSSATQLTPLSINHWLNTAGSTPPTPSDTTPPTFVSAAVSPDGLSLIITYDEPLSTTTAATTDFVVNVDSSPVTISSVAASGSAVTLTLVVAIQTSQTVEFSYTQPAGTDAIQDLAGNKAISLPITSATNGSTDTTPPTFVSAAVSPDGLSLIITYDEPLSTTTAATTDFVVNVDSSPVTISSVAASGSAVTLTLVVAIQTSQTVEFSYTQPAGTDAIQDLAGNKAISLPSTSVPLTPVTNHPPTGYLVINGDTSIGSTLTIDASAIADVDGLGVFSYSWSICENSVDTFEVPFLPDPAASTLVIPATYIKFSGDIPRSTVGETIRVVMATYIDGLGKREYVYNNGPIGPITPATGGGIPAVSPFRINGPTSSYLVSVGDVLTADTSTIADADGVGPFHYQWVTSYGFVSSYPPTNIGSDSATYTVHSSDNDIRCILTYTNGVGVLKTLLSNTLTNY